MVITLKYRRLPDGAFVVGDPATGRTGYAYPTSPHATMARTKASRVATEMAQMANAFASGDTTDYDARNWERLGGRS